MSRYTITIKNLIDNNFDFQLNNYPIFDENYRQTLNNNILNHYYMSEIGFETAPLFRFYLNQKLNEIMPLYNELYKAQKELLDNNLLLNNVNIKESYEGMSTTTTSSESNSNSNGLTNNKNLFQDTPQGSIAQTDIDAQTWCTNLTLDKNTTSTSIEDNSSSNGEGTNNYIKSIVGNNGGKFNIDILKDIKSNLMNIDLMIIEELNELFIGIY